MRRTFFLDTNVYRGLARMGTRLPRHLQGRIALSYITYLELVSQLQRSAKSQFSMIKEAIGLAWSHARRKFLPPPPEVALHALCSNPIDSSSVRHSRKGFSLAARIRVWEKRRQPILLEGRLYQLEDFTTRIIGGYQQDWVCLLNRFRQRAIEHADTAAPAAGGPITGLNATFVNHFIRAPNWGMAYARAVVGDNASDDLLLRASTATNAAACFVGAILKAALVDGYKFERKANDCFDHLQLQYLSREDLVFVTDERVLRQRIANSPQLSRVISLGDLLRADSD